MARQVAYTEEDPTAAIAHVPTKSVEDASAESPWNFHLGFGRTPFPCRPGQPVPQPFVEKSSKDRRTEVLDRRTQSYLLVDDHSGIPKLIYLKYSILHLRHLMFYYLI
jgi:hypothetical protein